MKNSILLLLVLVLPLCAIAQEETLINGNIESGGFGGPVLKITQIKGENAVMVGGRGGWIINHTFVIGGSGYGMVTDIKANRLVSDTVTKYLEMGYGGLDFEYIASSNDLIHLSMGLLAGGGGVGYKDKNYDMFNERHKMDSFFVLEPSVHANLNITHFFRIAAGISYRYISGLNSVVASNADLSGPSAILTLKFGKF